MSEIQEAIQQEIQDSVVQGASNSVGETVVKGSVASAVVYSGSKIIGGAVKNPVVTFGVGILIGFFYTNTAKTLWEVPQKSSMQVKILCCGSANISKI